MNICVDILCGYLCRYLMWKFYVDICVDILWIFCIMLVVAVPGVGKLQLLRTADSQVHGM